MNLLLVKGIITGLTLSIPFGPVGIYCMEKTLAEGRRKGFLAALGMISVDVIYSILVLFFMDKIDSFVIKYEIYFKLLIGVMLILLGIRKIKKKLKLKKIRNTAVGYIRNYFTTFFLAIGNISSFITIWMIFTTLRVYVDSFYNKNSGYLILLGVFCGGSSLWYLITWFLSHFRKTISDQVLIKITKIMGSIILVFGIFIFLLALKNIGFICLQKYRHKLTYLFLSYNYYI